jgi:long-chain acyl-CoA synthetase
MGERIVQGCERIYEAKKFNNLKEILENTKKEYGNCTAFKFRVGETENTTEMKYNEYIEEVNALGTSLISIGLKDKRIGVISENRYEWEEAYLSIICGTGVVVPLDKSLPENELISLISRSEIEAIFYSSKYEEIMKKVNAEKIGKIKFFISMDNEEKVGDVYSQKELVKLGKDLLKNGARSFLDAQINNEEMAIMLFTSGTTANSKAVMLSHKNICTNIYDIMSVLDINHTDTFLSFLPLHHVFECTAGFLYPFSIGAEIVFCRGIRHIAEDLKFYQVSIMISVPILFEQMYKKVMKSIEAKGKLETVKFGRKLAKVVGYLGIDIRKKLFKEIYDNLGGKVRIFIAGAAAFEPEVEKGFNELGILTYQGYGLSEASPVVSVEHKNSTRIGSIGKPFPSLQAKIVEPNEQGIGELAIKGDSVMLGYYNTSEKAITDDGWLLTGDLAYIDKDGFIFITGRKKSVIVLKNGKNVYPEEVESLINKIPGVKESFVYGKPEKDDPADLKICAEIVFDSNIVKEEYKTEDLEEIKKQIWIKVKEINKKMPTYKYVKEISITEEELIKTTTLKIKRFEEIKKVLK